MNKKEVIFEIMNLYDEKEKYANEINKLNAENQKLRKMMVEQRDKDLNSLELKMIEIAKKYLLEDCLYSWQKSRAVYDEEKDAYIFVSYKQWLENKLDKNRIPENLSIFEFETFLHNDLLEMYEDNKKEAIEEKKKEVNEE